MPTDQDSGRQYRAMWPLPGGQGHFLATRLEMLDWTRDRPHASQSDLSAWMRQRYELGTGTNTAEGYLQLVVRMGYLDARKGTVSLTERGRTLLANRDSRFVLDNLMIECLGLYETLEATAQLGTANGKALLTRLQATFPSWKTTAQYEWRLQWLYSLGCVEKAQGSYIIASAGQAALRAYHPVVPNDRLSPPTNPITNMRPPTLLPVPEPEEDTIPPDTGQVDAEAPVVVVMKDEAERLADSVRRASLESNDAMGFELVIAEAFRFLGFDAEHKSGSGDTDVLVTAGLGQETYRAVVDGKSSRHGRVGNQQVDWMALGRHKTLNKADYILVVAPNFSSGDLLDNALKTEAALLSAEDLAAVVRLHAGTPLSLIDLRELFRYAGRPELPLQRVQEKAAEIARLQRLVPDILQTFEHSYHVGVSGPIAADSLHLILARDYGRAVYTKDEIVAGLELLSAPLIGALRRVTDTAYALQMPITSVGRRFQAQARQLLEVGSQSPVSSGNMKKRSVQHD
jgi:hypothetical protein